MFAAKVLFNQQGVHLCVGIDTEGNECHLGHLFCHHSVIYSLVWVFSP